MSEKISVIHDLQLRIDLKGLLLYIHKTIDDNIIRNSDKIVTISEFSKLQIRSFYPSLSDDTIVNLGNSVSTNNSNGQCLVDEKYILYVGRICKMKNVITLVKAYITIKERLAGIKLVLVGKKTQYWYEHVLPIVDECCCNDIVIIEDCTELQLTSLYKNTELFVFPSLREGFGSPPIEAAIECVPVLSTNCDSLDEVLMGQVYTYNPPTNEDALSKKILDIINNKPNRQKLEAIRDKYLSCYSIDVVGKKIYGYLKKTQIRMNHIKLLSIRQNLGLCMVFCGVTTSMYLNFFFRGMYFTQYILLLSCALLCDRNTFVTSSQTNKYFKMIIAFQIIMLGYLFFTFETKTITPYIRQLSFHLYILVLSFILMRTPSLRERNFIPWIFGYSAILSIVSSVLHYLDLFEMERIVYGENFVLEVFTANIGAYINLICCLLSIRKDRTFLSKTVLIIFIFIDFYIITKSGKRSYFISALLVILFYLYKEQKMMAGLGICTVIYFILLLFIPEVQDITSTMMDRTINGFSDVYVNKKSNVVDWDDSASVRAWSQMIALQKLSEFTLVNYIFGGGYLFHFF